MSWDEPLPFAHELAAGEFVGFAPGREWVHLCGTRTPSYGLDDTGIVCGSGASAFDISTRAASDMTRHVIYD